MDLRVGNNRVSMHGCKSRGRSGGQSPRIWSGRR